MAGETDELAANARDGDSAAYEALFARVAERLLLYVRLQMGPRLAQNLEPLDLVQETYLAAHRGFSGFEAREEGARARLTCSGAVAPATASCMSELSLGERPRDRD